MFFHGTAQVQMVWCNPRWHKIANPRGVGGLITFDVQAWLRFKATGHVCDSGIETKYIFWSLIAVNINEVSEANFPKSQTPFVRVVVD
jgi:hypothetical protein